MKITKPLALVAAASALAVALVGSTDRKEDFKGPAYLMVQGGGLESSVVIHHGPRYREVDPDGGVLMQVLESVAPTDEAVPGPTTSRYYEVLEYWFDADVPRPNADGTPSEPLDPGLAHALSRIYPDEPGGAVWNQYLSFQRVPDFDGPRAESDAPYRPISGEGIALLRDAGLTFTQ